MSARPPFAGLAICLLLGACEEKRPKEQRAPAEATSQSSTASARVGDLGSGAPPAASALPVFDPALHQSPFVPLPEGVEKPALDDATRLGQALYSDARLSRGRDVSCASCHDLARFGADGEVVSAGTQKQRGRRNTPTVLNAAGSFAQGWDARATTIEELVPQHVKDPAVMGATDASLVAALSSVPAYVNAFAKAFPDERPAISPDTFGRAVAAYTKKLFTRSRWDRFLAGDASGLTDAEKTGLAMFVEVGCITCHQGKHLGGQQVQKLGIARPWPSPDGGVLDEGRFEVTKQEADRGMFKIPTLRNVAKTAPYLHDGSIATLEETTRLMARHQLGRELSPPQTQAIVTFLGALSADADAALPKALLAHPPAPRP